MLSVRNGDYFFRAGQPTLRQLGAKMGRANGISRQLEAMIYGSMMQEGLGIETGSPTL